MTGFVIKVLCAYLLGSILGSLVVGRIKGGVDIRTQGSGNAGGTNALRTQGKGFALAVIAIDVGKGVLAAAVLPGLGLFGPTSPALTNWLPVSCAAAVVIGHVFPLWYGFRGGKGAATLVGVLAVLAPIGLIPVLAVWGLSLMLSGYVGLSTMIAAASFPVYAFFAAGHALAAPLVIFGLVMVAFVVFTHRSNIVRMRRGEENRFHAAMILRHR